MSKFELRTLAAGETRYFEPKDLGYKDLSHLRRNLGVSLNALRKSRPDWVIAGMTVGEKLMVRRWK